MVTQTRSHWLLVRLFQWEVNLHPYMSRTFMCDRYRRYNKKRKQPPGKALKWNTETSRYTMTKEAAAGELMGKGGPRKVVTILALKNEDTCSFRFDIYIDMYGFYVKRSSGSVTHCNHFKRMATDIPTKLRHLTREQRKRAAELGKANTGPALELKSVQKLSWNGYRQLLNWVDVFGGPVPRT